MTDLSVRYQAPSFYRSDISETRVGRESRDEPSLTTEQVLAAPRIRRTYFLLGCVLFLPFDVLLNATPFFLSRLVGSSFYSTFTSYLSSVYTLTKLICQFYCTLTSKQSSPSRRISASIIAITVVIACLCLSTLIQCTPPAFFVFVLFSAASMAIAASYLCTAVYAQAALFGASVMQPMLSGQAAIGVVASSIQVVSSVMVIWSSPLKSIPTVAIQASSRNHQAEEATARIFFGVCAVFLCITLIAYNWSMRRPVYNSMPSTISHHPGVAVQDERTALIGDPRRITSEEGGSHVYRVFKQNMVFMFSIAYVFIVTLAVYPTITARVRPVNPNIHPLLFTAVHFLVGSIGYLIGQSSCSFSRLVIWSGRKILALSLLRTLFVPMFLLCNVERPATTSVPLVIRSDILFMIIVLTAGYTNGYVRTVALLAVSSLEHNPRLGGRREDVDVAATLSGSCMVLGLVLGSLCSFGIQALF